MNSLEEIQGMWTRTFTKRHWSRFLWLLQLLCMIRRGTMKLLIAKTSMTQSTCVSSAWRIARRNHVVHRGDRPLSFAMVSSSSSSSAARRNCYMARSNYRSSGHIGTRTTKSCFTADLTAFLPNRGVTRRGGVFPNQAFLTRPKSTTTTPSSTALQAEFAPGDTVKVFPTKNTKASEKVEFDEDALPEGTVVERSRNGWYTVRMDATAKAHENGGIDEEALVVKKRAGDLRLSYRYRATHSIGKSKSSIVDNGTSTTTSSGILSSTEESEVDSVDETTEFIPYRPTFETPRLTIVQENDMAQKENNEDGDDPISQVGRTKPIILDLDQWLVDQQQKQHIHNHPAHTLTDNNNEPISLLLGGQHVPNFINQCLHLQQTYQKWILFTDLHVSPSSLQTCLQVLRLTYQEAKRRNAGILFLGDFWHHRGSVRFDCLNAVLRELREWEDVTIVTLGEEKEEGGAAAAVGGGGGGGVPMVMIPGNHDQVTLAGYEHGLTPLRNAYWIQNHNNNIINNNSSSNNNNQNPTGTFPGPLIFSHATKFMNALFVPHVRNVSMMEDILASEEALASKALFVHADVTGAYMNNHVISQGGVSPRAFPPNRPIYSGHFHKPHVVRAPRAAPNVTIQYVGSPYQTSLSEAGQNKSLWMVDAKTWKVVEEIPIDVGRRHYRLNSVEELLLLPFVDKKKKKKQEEEEKSNDEKARDSIGSALYHGVPRKGDRVVVSIPRTTLTDLRRSSTADNPSQVDVKIKALRRAGVRVEILETTLDVQNGANGGVKDENGSSVWRAVEDMSPTLALQAFLEGEVSRRVYSNETGEMLKERGGELLEEMLDGEISSLPFESRTNGTMSTDVTFDSVEVEGYGPFAKKATYELSGRGLVLLRGSNLDGGYDSNGSGKTSLAMAPLWALTGSADPRPMQDGKVTDVINKGSKVAKVTLHGTVNNAPFNITRMKSARKTSLTFTLDDEDKTRQSVKETQLTIEELLGIDPRIASRTVFHGQFAATAGLLESTDSKLKEELSLVVPLHLWQKASSLARKKARQLSSQASEVAGMISIRTQDEAVALRRLDTSQLAMDSQWEEYQEEKHRAEMEMAEAESAAASSLIHNEADENADMIEAADEEAEADVERFQELLEDAARKWKDLEHSKSNLMSTIDAELSQFRADFDAAVARERDFMEELRESELALSKARGLVDSCTEALKRAYAKWDCPLPEEFLHENGQADADTTKVPFNGRISTEALEGLTPQLHVCPTCKQELPHDGEHSPDALTSKMQQELQEACRALEVAEDDLLLACDVYELGEQTLAEHVEQSSYAAAVLSEAREAWSSQVEELEALITKARENHAIRAADLSEAAAQLNTTSHLKSLRAAAAARLERRMQQYRSSNAVHQRLEAELEDVRKQIRDLESSADEAKKNASVMSSLADVFGPRGVQTFVLQHAVSALEMSSQRYLDVLSDGHQRLNLNLDDGDRISRSAAVQDADGSWMNLPLSGLSGGQWQRCSLALSLGFADFASRRGRLRSSLLILDEPVTHLDFTGRAHVGRVLRRMLDAEDNGFGGSLGLNLSTILVILQDLPSAELEDNFDHIDEVRKHLGSSSVHTGAD